MHMTTVCMHMTTMRTLLLHFWARDDTGPAVSDFVLPCQTLSVFGGRFRLRLRFLPC